METASICLTETRGEMAKRQDRPDFLPWLCPGASQHFSNPFLESLGSWSPSAPLFPSFSCSSLRPDSPTLLQPWQGILEKYPRGQERYRRFLQTEKMSEGLAGPTVLPSQQLSKTQFLIGLLDLIIHAFSASHFCTVWRHLSI